MTYYNAIVKTDYNSYITYHQVTNPQKLVEYSKKNLSVVSIFFYRLPHRKSKKGAYCGYWNDRKGLQLN